ncbi:hypothetical protein CDAR_573561 [Caerostris darwini]|uniref:Uncharacterized protein n=1 Tax=Caerostris darwini TaxID=1538125 RepID=A0AAV4TAE2_9ARAC|nr:hypothetical protein CDAR_573561 [Caerostris darwini]
MRRTEIVFTRGALGKSIALGLTPPSDPSYPVMNASEKNRVFHTVVYKEFPCVYSHDTLLPLINCLLLTKGILLQNCLQFESRNVADSRAVFDEPCTSTRQHLNPISFPSFLIGCNGAKFSIQEKRNFRLFSFPFFLSVTKKKKRDSSSRQFINHSSLLSSACVCVFSFFFEDVRILFFFFALGGTSLLCRSGF